MKGNYPIIYLDHAASTPVSNEVINEMIPYLGELFGNPSSLHKHGKRTKIALGLARKRVSILIGAKVKEIIFTSGGTESDNLALKGICKSVRNKDEYKNQIITSSIEHDAILETCKDLEKDAFDITYLKVDHNGIVNYNDIKKSLNEKTILVSIMLANNEVGSIQPIKKIAEIIHHYGNNIIFHTDAVQAVGKIPINVNQLDVDLLSISSHKINGPKGVGALYVRENIIFEPLLHGGGQESYSRSGTENVHGIVGFGKACEMSMKYLKRNFDHLEELKNYFIIKIQNEISNVQLNGSLENRLPNNLNFTFLGINGEDLLIKLDEDGIAASTGSACSVNKQKESHVLKAMGKNHEEITGSIRFSLGIQNTKKEIDKTVQILKNRVNELRKISPFMSKY